MKIMIRAAFTFLLVFIASITFVQSFSSFAFAHLGEEGETVIHMTDAGFSPKEVAIRGGEAVTFENIGKNPHWPASNIHPTHQIYPDFDPKKPIRPGESWEFMFEKEGEWRFHDHLNPEFKGSVSLDGDGYDSDSPAAGFNLKLEAKLNETSETISFFFKKLYFRLFPKKLEEKLAKANMLDVAKKEDELDFWLRILGSQRVMEEILEDAGGGSITDCHTQAHQAGRLAYDIYGAKIFSEGDASCHSGFYHGGMEAFLAGEGTNGLSEKIKNLCSVFATSFGNFECLHGVGHGVMAYEDYDMLKALANCKKLGDTFSETSCYGGVFMENIVTGQGIGANPSHATEWVSEDPHFPCNRLEADFDLQYQCYQMQTSWMLTLFNYDFDRVASECLNSPEDMKSVCFKSLGRDAAGHTLRDSEKIVDLCAKVPKEADYYEQCVIGAVNVIVDFWGGNLKDQASEFCRLLSAPGKEACYSTLAWRLDGLFETNEERVAACKTFEPKYKNLCI